MNRLEAEEKPRSWYCLYCQERWDMDPWTMPASCPNCGSEYIDIDEAAEELQGGQVSS